MNDTPKDRAARWLQTLTVVDVILDADDEIAIVVRDDSHWTYVFEVKPVENQDLAVTRVLDELVYGNPYST